MEAVAVYECSRCGAQFCNECGDIKRKLCYDCLEWKESDGDDSEDLDDKEDWDNDNPN